MYVDDEDESAVTKNPASIAAFYFEENKLTGKAHWQHMEKERMWALFAELLRSIPQGAYIRTRISQLIAA